MKVKMATLFAAAILFIVSSGCSKRSSNPVSSNNGSGGSSSSVTFQIRSEAGQNGGTEFDASASENVTLSQINVSEAASGLRDTILVGGTAVYQKNTFYRVNEYLGVQAGMRFTFEFLGKTSADNKDFDVTAEYKVQADTNFNPTFQVQLVYGQQQAYFELIPDTNVTVNLVTINCAAANVNNEQVQEDGTTIYSAVNQLFIGPITANLQSGQQWTFKITGKVGNSNGQSFTSNASYQVP